MKNLNKIGQNAVEYTLMVVGVVVVTIIALRQGGLVDTAVNKSLARSASSMECMALNTCYDPSGICSSTCGNGCCETFVENSVLCNADCPCVTAADCDDGLSCTGIETCTNGICAGGPPTCDDGLVCNGVETCDVLLVCQTGVPLPLVSDGINCTVESCVEPGVTISTPDDSLCLPFQTCSVLAGGCN